RSGDRRGAPESPARHGRDGDRGRGFGSRRHAAGSRVLDRRVDQVRTAPMARFFIDRPIFAWVIAIIIMLAGGLAVFTLPISQYPTIAPPTVSISATYPGASAKVVQDSVTQIIEQNMKG